MKTKIGRYFTLGELIKNRSDNIPDTQTLINLVALTNKLLDPIREQFGKTVVTSGYRNKDYNKSAGGATNSQHVTGQAADIVLPEVDLQEVFDYVIKNLDYDQLILEKTKNSIWIHISYNLTKNRKQALTYTNGVYKPYKA